MTGRSSWYLSTEGASEVAVCWAHMVSIPSWAFVAGHRQQCWRRKLDSQDRGATAGLDQGL